MILWWCDDPLAGIIRQIGIKDLDSCLAKFRIKKELLQMSLN